MRDRSFAPLRTHCPLQAAPVRSFDPKLTDLIEILNSEIRVVSDSVVTGYSVIFRVYTNLRQKKTDNIVG